MTCLGNEQNIINISIICRYYIYLVIYIFVKGSLKLIHVQIDKSVA